MRWVLSFVTLGVLFAAGFIAPDRPPAPRATRVSVSALPVQDVTDLSDARAREAYQSPVSAAEAVQIALDRGAEIAATREASTPQLRLAAAVQVATPVTLPQPDPAEALALRVTADRVNLRGGPGTDNPVVGSAAAGERLIPVADPVGDWIEIRRPAGDTAWVHTSFLAAEG